MDREKTKDIAKLIAKLLANDSGLEEIKTRQRQYIIENFNIKQSAENIEKFYINAINV